MDYAAVLLGLAAAGLAGQEDSTPAKPTLHRPVSERPTAPGPSHELRFTYASANPRCLDRLDLASWQEEGGDLLYAVLGYDSRDPAWLKAFHVAAAGAAHFAIDYSTHEFGHLSSFSRAGCRDMALWAGSSAGETPTALDFLKGTFDRTPTPISVSNSDWRRIEEIFKGKPGERAAFLVLMEGGGLNQEQIGLAHYADRLNEEGLALLEIIPFILAASSTIRYPATTEESDLANYVDRLEDLGVRGDVSTLKLLSALRFLSGSGLSLMSAFLSELLGVGEREAAPLRLHLGEGSHLDWPEFESYLSLSGPTAKVSVPIRLSGLNLWPSYERSFATGSRVHELGLRARADVAPDVRFLAAAFAGDEGGYWIEGGFEARLLGWLVLNASYVSASGHTVHREIFGANLPMIDSTERGLRLTIGISWAF